MEILKPKNKIWNTQTVKRQPFYGWKYRTGQTSLSRPNENRLYVKILKSLISAPASKRDVYDSIGMIATPTHYYNCIWASLRNAGFLDMERKGTTFEYKITKQGMDYLKMYGLIKVNLMEVKLW